MLFRSELRLHPSYSSVEVFLRECRNTGSEHGLMNVDAEYEARIDQFGEKLAAWRAVRQSAAQGTQSYDKASLTRALIPARSSKSSHIPFQSSLVDLDERFRLPNQHGVPLHHQAPP